MGCRHGPQSQSGEVITTYINKVDSDLQMIQKYTKTAEKKVTDVRNMSSVPYSRISMNEQPETNNLIRCFSFH